MPSCGKLPFFSLTSKSTCLEGKIAFPTSGQTPDFFCGQRETNQTLLIWAYTQEQQGNELA